MSTPERRPQPRIGDAERDRAVDLLSDHLAQGRLTQGEFDERVGVALQARTAAELEPLFRDLPGDNPGAPPRPETLEEQTHRRVTEMAAEVREKRELSRTKADPRLITALTVAVAVAWPACLVAYFVLSFDLWWLFLLPLALSIALGNLKRGDSRHFGFHD